MVWTASATQIVAVQTKLTQNTLNMELCALVAVSRRKKPTNDTSLTHFFHITCPTPSKNLENEKKQILPASNNSPTSYQQPTNNHQQLITNFSPFLFFSFISFPLHLSPYQYHSHHLTLPVIFLSFFFISHIHTLHKSHINILINNDPNPNAKNPKILLPQGISPTI